MSQREGQRPDSSGAMTRKSGCVPSTACRISSSFLISATISMSGCSMIVSNTNSRINRVDLRRRLEWAGSSCRTPWKGTLSEVREKGQVQRRVEKVPQGRWQSGTIHSTHQVPNRTAPVPKKVLFRAGITCGFLRNRRIMIFKSLYKYKRYCLRLCFALTLPGPKVLPVD